MERVRTQFLSLRQLCRSYRFSARGCWYFAPVLAAISDLSSGPLIGRIRPSSPNGSFLSKALDSADSVRFSKFECFELFMNSDEMGFYNSSRTGKSIPSLCFRSPGLRTEFEGGLRLIPRIFPFLGDGGRRPVRSRTEWQAFSANWPNSPALPGGKLGIHGMHCAPRG